MEDTNKKELTNRSDEKELKKADTEHQDGMQEDNKKKKITPSMFIVPGIIAIILIAFAGFTYYQKVVKPDKELDKEVGYTVENYVTLGQYTGFEYDITQEQWDECINGEIQSYDEVKRGAVDTDQIAFNYTGYIKDKADKNISQKDAELIIGEDESGIYKKFSDAMRGHKAGEILTVEVSGAEASELSLDESKYTEEKVIFKLKIKSVSEMSLDKITDKWVKKWYFEDYGLENTKDFYEWTNDDLIENEAKPDIWQKAVDAANMEKYPDELYVDIVDEFLADAQYRAEEWDMTQDEYLYNFCGYTDETLEEEYLNGVKSELVMWAIVKEEHMSASDEEIEQKYEDTYTDVGCDTAEDMKALYSKEEIKKAVLLDKAQNYVYENSKVKESYKIK